MGFLKSKGFLTVVALVFALSITINMTNKSSRTLTYFEKQVRDLLLPIEKPFNSAINAVRNTISDIASIGQLKRTNKLLSDRVEFLENENMILEEERRENIRLRSLLHLKSSIVYRTVAARVVSRDPSDWSSTVTIDKGSNDGLKANMAVIARGGLVGRIISVSGNTATVLLITDSRSAVSALIRRSRDIVIVEGNSEKPGYVSVKPLNAKLISGNEQWSSQVRLKLGDTVISSGLGGVFPKGLTVGVITAIGKGKYGVSKNALVKPAVDFGRFEEVLIVVGSAPPVGVNER